MRTVLKIEIQIPDTFCTCYGLTSEIWENRLPELPGR